MNFNSNNKIFNLKKNRLILYYSVVINFIFFLNINISNGQTLTKKINGIELKNTIRFNFIPVKMPIKKFPKLKPIMGFSGLNYLIPLNKSLYIGAGFHYALTGDQGGLFTLGAEIGLNNKIYNNIYLDTNIHFGGGSGYRYLVNDGAFINTNIGLEYKTKNYSFGVKYSYLIFIAGKIKDNAISFSFGIPSILRFLNYNDANIFLENQKLSFNNMEKKTYKKYTTN